MTTKKASRRTSKVFRSMKEFKEHYFPKTYESEVFFKMKEDPESLGANIAEEYLEKVRGELQREK